MITPQTLPRTIGIGFFFCWLIILLAGADKPPPPGFIFIILLDLLCAYVVYRRIPTYVAWHSTRKRARYGYVVLDGLVAGFICALLPLLLSSGEPTVEPTLIDYAIWLTVLCVMGMLNSISIYAITGFLSKKLTGASRS